MGVPMSPNGFLVDAQGAPLKSGFAFDYSTGLVSFIARDASGRQIASQLLTPDQFGILSTAIAGGSLASSNGWKRLPLVLGKVGLITGFGSSPPDATYSGSAAATVFYDQINGSDSNSGASYLLPKQNPSSTPAGNTKHLIAPGSRYGADFRYVNSRFTLNNSGTIFSTYDRNGGGEILTHRNPFSQAILGGWPTEEELATKYWQIIGNSNDLTRAQHFDATAGTGIINSNGSATGIIVRGGCITGCGYSLMRSNCAWRVEDMVLRESWNNDSSEIGYAYRSTVEIDGLSFARLFIENIAQDVFYMVAASASGCKNALVSDCAIRNGGFKAVQSATHCDVFQLRSYPTLQVNRCVIEQIMDPGINPTGSIYQWGPSDPVAANDPNNAATGGGMTDCVLISNTNCINAPPEPGQNFLRVLGYMEREEANPSVVRQVVQSNVAGTHTDCVYIFPNRRNNSDSIFGGTSQTLTRVAQL